MDEMMMMNQGNEDPFQDVNAFAVKLMMCMNAFQQVKEENEQLRQRVAALESENAALTETVEQWKKRDDARRMFEPLLKKSQVTQLCKDIKRRVKELTRLSEGSPEDRMAYSQMHLVFELIASMDEEETDKNEQKTEKRNRNEENRRQIINFIADNEILDSKTVAKAIGLKPSRTRDYLKQLVADGILEIEGEYKNRKYKIKK